jgi:hypothetical protein
VGPRAALHTAVTPGWNGGPAPPRAACCVGYFCGLTVDEPDEPGGGDEGSVAGPEEAGRRPPCGRKPLSSNGLPAWASCFVTWSCPLIPKHQPTQAAGSWAPGGKPQDPAAAPARTTLEAEHRTPRPGGSPGRSLPALLTGGGAR